MGRLTKIAGIVIGSIILLFGLLFLAYGFDAPALIAGQYLILGFLLVLVGGGVVWLSRRKPAVTAATLVAEPKQLPTDTSKAEYQIMKAIQSGKRKPKDIAKMLTMEEKEVKNLFEGLKVKGYISKDDKLTSKAIDVIS